MKLFNFLYFLAVSEESYNFFCLACKQLLLCQEDPLPLITLVLKESNDKKEEYRNLLSFIKRLSLGLNFTNPGFDMVNNYSCVEIMINILHLNQRLFTSIFMFEI